MCHALKQCPVFRVDGLCLVCPCHGTDLFTEVFGSRRFVVIDFGCGISCSPSLLASSCPIQEVTTLIRRSMSRSELNKWGETRILPSRNATTTCSFCNF
jgi:hypothetical protein